MGIRGELFSTTVALQNRTYFFNVKENRLGDLYLNIVESKNKETGGFDRQSVILFADDLQEFLSGFDESLRVLEKAVREQKRNSAGPGSGRFERGGEKPGRSEGKYGRSDGDRPKKKLYSREGGPKGGPRPAGSKDRPKDGTWSKDGPRSKDAPRPKDGPRSKDGPRRGGKMVVKKTTYDKN
jgi:hypothetical protein